MNLPSAPERPSWRKAIHRLATDSRLRRLGWLGGVLLVWALAAAWRYGLGLDDLAAWGQAGLLWLRERPMLLLLAIVVLPGLPVPAAPLLILAGAVLTPRFGAVMAVLMTWAALACNMAWTYWVASGPGRRQVDRLLGLLDVRLPALSPSNALRLALLVRVTPAIPLFLQNLVLGFLRIPFRVYVAVSAMVQLVYVTGFVVLGESLQAGRARLGLAAIALVVIAVVVAGYLRERLYRRVDLAGMPPGQPGRRDEADPGSLR
jgi:uncharacterized membrane protein YdjX (TVP38/TMEM64 family)